MESTCQQDKGLQPNNSSDTLYATSSQSRSWWYGSLRQALGAMPLLPSGRSYTYQQGSAMILVTCRLYLQKRQEGRSDDNVRKDGSIKLKLSECHQAIWQNIIFIKSA